MENVFKYYQFSSFFIDQSGSFSGNEISYSELNETHFLIFEKNKETYNLYVSRYQQRKDIGQKTPDILELLIENYDKSIPEHRLAIKQYVD
jgi:hypothetical protein